MLMKLDFERAFFNASLEVIRLLDGDIFLQRASKYQFATKDPFPSQDLKTAGAVTGVASAWPLYADWHHLFGAAQSRRLELPATGWPRRYKVRVHC
jgi:hypothetical protein